MNEREKLMAVFKGKNLILPPGMQIYPGGMKVKKEKGNYLKSMREMKDIFNSTKM